MKNLKPVRNATLLVAFALFTVVAGVAAWANITFGVVQIASLKAPLPHYLMMYLPLRTEEPLFYWLATALVVLTINLIVMRIYLLVTVKVESFVLSVLSKGEIHE